MTNNNIMKKQVFTLFLVLISLMSSAQEFTNYYSGYLKNHSVITDDSLVYAGCNKAINIYYKDRTFKEIKPVNGYVYSSTKDALGKLYFAVSALNESEDAGIITYDGETWDFIPVTTGYTTQELLTTTFDLDNNLWVGINPLNYSSTSIIAKYNGTEWINYSTIGDSIIISDPSDIVCDTNNIIYAGTDYGVIAISATDTSIYTSSNSELSIGCIHGSYVDKDNNIWFGGHSHKPNYFDGEEWHLDSLAPGDGYYSIFQDPTGYMWFGANGLHVQNDTGYVSYTDGNIIEFNGISNIIHDSQNNIWIATQDNEDARQGCLVKYDEDGFHNCFPNTHIGTPREIAFPNNDILLGTNAPLSYYNGLNWSIDILPESFDNITIRSICTDVLGNFWLATTVGLYKRSPEGVFETIPYICGDTISSVKCVTSFGNTVWVKTIGANLYKYDGAFWTKIDMTASPTTSFYRIVPHDDNEIWAASYSGAIRYDGTNWTNYSFEEGLQASIVNDYAFVNDSVWMATNLGIALLHDNVITMYLNDTTLDVGYRIFNTIAVDKNGIIWAGCVNGVFKFDGTIGELILPTGYEESIYYIREDHDQNLWFCGENAISKYTFDNSGIENPKAEQKSCKLYPNPAQNEINIELPADIKTDILEIYSSNGAVIYQQKVQSGTNKINIESLPAGMYLVRIREENLFGKFVKK